MKNDFAFFVGTWTSKHRRLRQYLNASNDWDEFTGISKCWSIFDGAGTIDEITFPGKAFSGATVRLYSQARDEWSLYWINSQTGLGLPPQVGRFSDRGCGVFTADDVHEGKPIKVVYMWSQITPESCRWEQALSADRGATWETNWIAEFTRTS